MSTTICKRVAGMVLVLTLLSVFAGDACARRIRTVVVVNRPRPVVTTVIVTGR